MHRSLLLAVILGSLLALCCPAAARAEGWMFDHFEGLVPQKDDIRPKEFIEKEPHQPPDNLATFYVSRATVHEWAIVMQWTDPAVSVPEGGTVTVPLTITRTRCGTADTGKCDHSHGISINVYPQSSPDCVTYGDDNYLRSPRTPDQKYGAWAGDSVQQATAQPSIQFTPFSGAKCIRIIVGSNDGAAGATLATYYYRKSAPGGPYRSPAQSWVGTWCFRGIQGQLCTIAELSGGQLRLVTEQGITQTGHLEGDTVMLNPPFSALSGTISRDRNRIHWSNGESWVRCE